MCYIPPDKCTSGLRHGWPSEDFRVDEREQKLWPLGGASLCFCPYPPPVLESRTVTTKPNALDEITETSTSFKLETKNGSDKYGKILDHLWVFRAYKQLALVGEAEFWVCALF